MNKRNIISLSGELAAGKGAVSNILKDKLNYTIFRNGEYFRTLAKEYDMDVTTFGKYVEKHPEIDQKIESRASEYAKNHDNFIIDARLGWYVVPNSFKVYLTIDLNEAAKRAFYDPNRKETENFQTIEDQKNDIKRRFEIENNRYKKLYNIDKTDKSNYDLVLDTTNKTPEEVANLIIEQYKTWLSK